MANVASCSISDLYLVLEAKAGVVGLHDVLARDEDDEAVGAAAGEVGKVATPEAGDTLSLEDFKPAVEDVLVR